MGMTFGGNVTGPVVLERENDGFCPFIEWYRSLPDDARDKLFVRLERLRETGHKLRGLEADYFRDRI